MFQLLTKQALYCILYVTKCNLCIDWGCVTMNKILAFIRARKKLLIICVLPTFLLIWYFHPVTLVQWE